MVEGQKFLEVIVAPGYADDALALLRDRWKNVRLLDLRGMGVPPMSADHGRDARATSVSIRSIDGGFLVQEADAVSIVESEWKMASARQPSEAELADLRFAWLACKHVKSNAIVLARNGATVGIGGGQVDRVGAARIAIEKAGAGSSDDRARGSVVASDAFFPFPDGPQLLLKAGITAIVQPGGSTRDPLTIDAVNAAGAAMIFTGRRHFRH
jgi:phosphoribosylaminoimidazolecarboxamide formyltransferase/IMP cyclohydrolase